MSKPPEFLILKPTAGWLPENNDLVELEFSDFILNKNNVGSTSCELDVKHLGHFKRQKSAGHNLELKGKLIYVKKLTDHLDFWEGMMSKDQAFAEKVVEWVNDKRWGRVKHEACWVVGLLLCQEVAVTTSQEQAREWQARGDVQLGSIAQASAAVHGIPIPTDGAGNASAQVGSQTVDYSYFSVQGKGKYVFALELKIISSKKGKPELTDKVPKAKMKLGNDDEDLDPEDLILKDQLGEDDWENLLQPSS